MKKPSRDFFWTSHSTLKDVDDDTEEKLLDNLKTKLSRLDEHLKDQEYVKLGIGAQDRAR